MFDPISWTVIAVVAGAVVVGTGIGYGIKSITSSSGNSEEQQNFKSNIVNNDIKIDEHHDELMSILYFFAGCIVLFCVVKGFRYVHSGLRLFYARPNNNNKSINSTSTV